MKNRNLPFYLGAIGLIIFLAAIGWQSAGTKTSASATPPKIAAPMPNLSGDEAKDYLAQNNLSESLGEAIQRARYGVNRLENRRDDAFEAKNPQQNFSAYFTADAVNLVSGGKDENWNLSLKLKSFGRGAAQAAALGNRRWTVDKTKISAVREAKSEISDREFPIEEIFENKPEGLEQSFVIREKIEARNLPAEDRLLKIVLSIGGDLQPEIADGGQALILKRNGVDALRYDKLKSWDAKGAELISKMELVAGELSLVVDDENAAYPITIDPTFTQIKKLLAADGAANDSFGNSIAVSGGMAIVGAASGANARGAAYIFYRNAGGANNWSQVKKLTASDGADGDAFGSAVAVEGNTIAVGSKKAAYIFEREAGGANQWGEVRIISEAVSETQLFGINLSLSGNTLIVGSSSPGGAYVYDRNQGGINNWGLVKLLGLEGGTINDAFPGAISISGDTAIIASYGSQGKAQIYRRDAGGANNWGRVQRIFVSGSSFYPNAVGISGDTAVLGGLHIFGEEAVYVFGRNAGGADNWGLVKTITAADGAAQDFFGLAVGISGDRIVVGANLDDVGGNADQGSAHIFERNAGGADNWGLIKKLTASDGAAGDRFGFAVAIDGNTAIVGATFDDVGANIDQGAADVFLNQNTAWTEVTKPLPANCTVDDAFGFSVAVSGDTAIVGAFKADVGAVANQGAAYIFRRASGGANNWGLVKTITAADGAAGDRFGWSVAVSGDAAIVGAYFQNNQGAAYLFERNAGGADNWGETKKLTASDGTGNEQFGFSVSINGDRLVVGATGAGIGANIGQGSAYVFERDAGGANNWGEVKMIFAADGAAFDSFGSSVAVSGDTVVVGAQLHDGAFQDQGAAYVFERDAGGAGNWGQAKKLSAAAANFLQQFGNSVAVAGDIIVVGAFSEKIGANTQQGAAHVFGRSTGGANNWGLIKKLVASDPGAYRFFGGSTSIDGDTIVVGAVGGAPAPGGSLQGAAYVFKQNAGGADFWGETKKILASDRADYDQFGGAVAVSGNTTIIGAAGDDVNGVDGIGSSYIFVDTGADWIEQRKTLPPLPADCGATDDYGFSVAIDGDTAIVGAPGDDVGINTDQGSAYVLERNQGGANNWGLVKLLTAPDGAAGDSFGTSVAISAGKLIVGAPSDAIGANQGQGSAYLYERNAGGTNNFGEVKKIKAADGAAGDSFGYSVAISSDTAIVGARFDAVGANIGQGSAYVFERDAGGANNWDEVKKITGSDATSTDNFGTSVGISGGIAIVGSPRRDAGSGFKTGAAYVFERDRGGANNWGEGKLLRVELLPPPQINYETEFGYAVAVSGNIVIVGAPAYVIGGATTASGAAFVFEQNAGGANNWGLVKTITAADGAAGDRFGNSAAISGGAAIVGAPYDDVGGVADQGSAYIFEQNAGGADNWGKVTKLTASDAAANDLFGAAVAASGDNFFVGAYLASSPAFDGKQSENSFGGNAKGAGYVFRGAALAPTAANVSVGGRVLTAAGGGISKARVTLTGANGETRSATTNSFGWFRFDEVPAGETYTIEVRHKKYQFAPRVLTVSDDVADLDFTAED